MLGVSRELMAWIFWFIAGICLAIGIALKYNLAEALLAFAFFLGVSALAIAGYLLS